MVKNKIVEISIFGIFKETKLDKEINKIMEDDGYEVWITTLESKIWKLK